jgi:hypothetical protein
MRPRTLSWFSQVESSTVSAHCGIRTYSSYSFSCKPCPTCNRLRSLAEPPLAPRIPDIFGSQADVQGPVSRGCCCWMPRKDARALIVCLCWLVDVGGVEESPSADDSNGLWSSVGSDGRRSGSLCASLERSQCTKGGAIILGATHHKFRIGWRALSCALTEQGPRSSKSLSRFRAETTLFKMYRVLRLGRQNPSSARIRKAHAERRPFCDMRASQWEHSGKSD